MAPTLLLLWLTAGLASLGQPAASSQLERESSRYLVDGGNLFACVDTARLPYDLFVRQYGRQMDALSSQQFVERRDLFKLTLQRTIVLNKIIQNEILNLTNYLLKPAIRNYHFVQPVASQAGGPDELSVRLWYADINDCELGLIKYHLFNMFYFLENNRTADALKVATDNSFYLPLLEHDGLEQLVNILLVRLYDRLQGDDMMNQLFQWPLYLRRLAAYAYNRQQVSEPNFKAKLSLVAFAYPAYFKDLKYYWPASNRTSDNLHLHAKHERFNGRHQRRFASRQERNKRLTVYRQHASLVELLNEEPGEWLNASGASDLQPAPAAKLQLSQEQQQQQPARETRFSDLTDQEFVAYLTWDFSQLENNTNSMQFIEDNFPAHHLDEQLRAELAAELELRRLLPADQAGLARQVVDELISDVGLPIGPLSHLDLAPKSLQSQFLQVARTFRKSYRDGDTLALIEERQRRFDQFQLNYGRFRAWHIKEGWAHLSGAGLESMLRLADMSWLEIKLSLFKLCCLTQAELDQLTSRNASLHYLASHDFMCQPMGDSQQQQQQPDNLAALELYYYYSVHFNKHHQEQEQFRRRFSIFRRNLDQIRRHSCLRSLTLGHSLLDKIPDTLSTIDNLDPRRSYTDDINLDRFLYFSVPKLAAAASSSSGDVDLLAQSRRRYQESPSRAGVTYNRQPFDALLDSPPASTQDRPLTSHASQLGQLAQSPNWQAQRYRQLNAHHIYQMVLERYKLCKRNEPINEDALQCRSTGPLADGLLQQQQAGALGNSQSLQALQRDSCAYYWMGLDFWNKDLIKPDPLSNEIISQAKCF